MVAKISSGSLIYGVLSYNQTKVDEQLATVIFTNRMIEPKDGEYDIAICMRSFEPYLLANQRTEKPVLHISINPDPKDKLSDEQLSEIAQTYMDKMGYGDQPFIVFKHEDIDRHHIHIVSLRVDENGKKIDHNFEYKKSMDICRALEQQYGLVPADQKQRQESAPLKAVDYEKGDIKRQVANVIRSVAQAYHFLSLKEYSALLSFYNVHVEEIRGEVKGKPYRGLVYSALNSKGKKVGNPFNASSFGKSVGIDALEKRMEKSTEIIKQKGLKERSKKVIVSAIKSHSDRISFEKELTKTVLLFCLGKMNRDASMVQLLLTTSKKLFLMARDWEKSFRPMLLMIGSASSQNPKTSNNQQLSQKILLKLKNQQLPILAIQWEACLIY